MRALGAVGAALALGTGAVAVAAVGGASSTRPGEPAALGQRPGLTASGGGGRSTPAGATPAPAGRGPSRSASASSTGATGPTREPRVAVRAKVAVPSTDSATRTLRSALGRP
ncbi:MAG: hypothetical protein ACXVEL_18075, partial [Nocardioidaceae bacterium]